jgi:hypothetical protein
VKDDQIRDENSYSVPPVTAEGIALSDYEKAEALAESGDSVSVGDRSFGPGSY